ncbi:hypothetical protein Apa02nite_050080 [Actinoplanes palleronii]|uniref:Uncharacterized protein n=2 Tax=Actinoplanes palleronii TaxID=113570 RepID=A0ABQ4BDY3_9ACTN|nr:hypothetical protein Apa02nite_050080 [Actinoplanes palleronii]
MRPTWQANLPEHHDLLAPLPDVVDRAIVAKRAAGAADSEALAVQAFVTAMVWGYGPVGYGAFRTARVLRENPQAAQTLREAAQVVRSEGGAAAFAWLAQHRLRYLGVAFATKYLYFCNTPGSAPALILDRLVQRWLRQHAGCQVRLDWQVGDYTRYLHLVGAWADELGTTPDIVEYLMFSDTLSQEPGRSPWAAPDTETAVLPGSDGDATTAVLEAIEDAASAFAALADVSPADVDDFERGIRQLRRILLARNA